MQWDSLLTRPSEIEASDLISFDVIGVNMDGDEEIIMDDVTGDRDLNTIDAVEFPYLKIVFNAGDDVSLTPAQLNKWLVTYTPAPEGLLV